MYKITAAAVALFIALPFVSFSQNNDDMKAMMAAAMPGESHQMLARSAGSWTETVTLWMQPGAEPMVSQAQATNEMIMQGRYLKSTNSGNLMGMPFEGIGTTGYDNAKKQFVSSWIDNMGTGIMMMSGTWEAASKSIAFTGSETDPVSGKDKPFREVWQFVDDDHQVMAMYNQMDGKEFKVMEIKYTRK